MLTVNGLKTSVQISGEGPVVLLLHGWGGSIQSMAPVAQRLKGFETHVLDLPGFGDTAAPPAPWGVLDYARWVIAYMDRSGIEQAHLIGHSFGGRISLILGSDYAQRVNKIVLSNSAGVRLPPPLNIRFYYLVRRVLFTVLSLPGLGGLKAQLREYFRQKYGSADYLSAGPLVETFKLVIAEDLLPYARRVKAPTLLFWGDQDEDTPLKAGRILEEAIPDAGLIVYEGAGHFAYLERLGDFVRVIEHFFKND